MADIHRALTGGLSWQSTSNAGIPYWRQGFTYKRIKNPSQGHKDLTWVTWGSSQEQNEASSCCNTYSGVIVHLFAPPATQAAFTVASILDATLAPFVPRIVIIPVVTTGAVVGVTTTADAHIVRLIQLQLNWTAKEMAHAQEQNEAIGPTWSCCIDH